MDGVWVLGRKKPPDLCCGERTGLAAAGLVGVNLQPEKGCRPRQEIQQEQACCSTDHETKYPHPEHPLPLGSE